jgi:acyl carrier protein
MTRLYRTGDLVRYHADGNVNFIGRADSQVKLRGFRIELSEIETIINQHPRVETCAVVLSRDADGEGRLAAYVVGDETGNLKEDLREFLRGKLPDFMLPSAFVFLSALPLNANGKVNRRHLPPPEPVTPTPHPAVVPRDATEAILTQIWKELLNVPSVGTRDNFFELGGHSLLVLRLLARIEKSFGKALPVATVFQVPTVEGLARLLREEPREPGARSRSIVPIQPTGSRPPLMLVHGAGGGMFWGYANLAEHLGPDQPVYGFKAADVSDLNDGTTIEAMAAEFVGQLRAFQPRGPYYLGGYCFGGNVAYEMAR